MTNPNVYRNIILCYKNLIKKEENLRKRYLDIQDNEDTIIMYKEKRFEYAYKAYLLFPDVESSVLDLANIYLEIDDKIEFDAFTINRRPELLKAKLILEKLLTINPDSSGAKALLFSIVNGYKWSSCDKECIYKGSNINEENVNNMINEENKYPININDYNKYIIIQNSTEEYIIKHFKEYSEICGGEKTVHDFKYSFKNNITIIKCPQNINFYNYHNLSGWFMGYEENKESPDLTAVISLHKINNKEDYYATLDPENSYGDTMIGVFDNGKKFSQFLPEGFKAGGNINLEDNNLEKLNVCDYLKIFDLTKEELINFENNYFKTIEIKM